jgi:hypothetical protein
MIGLPSILVVVAFRRHPNAAAPRLRTPQRNGKTGRAESLSVGSRLELITEGAPPQRANASVPEAFLFSHHANFDAQARCRRYRRFSQ